MLTLSRHEAAARESEREGERERERERGGLGGGFGGQGERERLCVATVALHRVFIVAIHDDNIGR